MGLRRQAREVALRALYLVDITKMSVDNAIETVTKGEEFHVSLREFMELLVRGTIENKPYIDSAISGYTKNWELDRMASIDRNIIRMGAFEVIKTPETPINVIIDEAVEIAKKYSTADSGKFVNGILDRVKDLRGQQPSEK